MAKTTRHGERREEILGGAGEQQHRHEHDADAKRGDEGRRGDLLRAIEHGAHQRLLHGHVAVGVFDFHGGVVHQDADRQRQAAERHHVDGLAHQAAAR